MSTAGPGVTAPGSAVRAGLLLALTGVVLFSFTLPFTKIALRGYDPVVIAMGRAAIAGVVVGRRARGWPRVRWPGRAALRPLLGIGLGVVVGFPVLTTIALQSTTSAHAAVVIAGLPIATAVLGVVRTGEHPSRSFWYAAVSGTLALAVFACRGAAPQAVTWSPTCCCSGRCWRPRTATSRARSSPGRCPAGRSSPGCSW